MSKQRRGRRTPAIVVMAMVSALVVGGTVAAPASAAGVTYWVDGAAASTGPGTGCGADAAYATIQAAINAAGVGDIVEVCPGTYAGPITINKADLTLRGALAGVPAGPEANPAGRGTGESIIEASGTNVINWSGSTSVNSTIDGFTLRNTMHHGITVGTSGHTIVNNILEFDTSQYTATNAQQSGFITGRFNGHTITNNAVIGFRYGFNFQSGNAADAPSAIEENYVEYVFSGVILGTNTADGHSIRDNVFVARPGAGGPAVNTPSRLMEISGNTMIGTGGSSGVYLPGLAPKSGTQVLDNDISGFTWGIYLGTPHADLPAGSPPNELHGNNITVSTTWAIFNQAAPGVLDADATCNWFGTPDGPGIGTSAPAGNRVSAGVDVTPWLVAPAPGGACTGGLPVITDPVVSLGDQSGLERDEVQGSVFVPVTLSKPATAPVTVSVYTVDGTAVAGQDYTRWGTPTSPRTVVIPAGSLQGTINVPVLTDDVVEADETFSVVIASVSGGDAVIGDGTGTATIIDSDGSFGPNPLINVSNPTFYEGNDGQRRAQFQIHLSRVPSTNVTISYRTEDGSAIAGVDYVQKLPGTVVFAPGQISKTVDVLVNSDTEVNGDREFTLEVSVTGGSPVEELNMSGVARILDED